MGGTNQGWITCHFMSFETVFRSYQNDEGMMMKGLCSGTPFTVEKISTRTWLDLGTPRSVGQRLTH